MPYSDPETRTQYHKKYNKAYQQSPQGKRILWAANVKFRFGLDPEDVARMYESQGHKCKGCLVDLKLDHDTHIDHDHKTDMVRGLLCGTCNQCLGMAYDNPYVLRRLADYLELSCAGRT